jgi:hypothetical protein
MSPFNFKIYNIDIRLESGGIVGIFNQRKIANVERRDNGGLIGSDGEKSIFQTEPLTRQCIATNSKWGCVITGGEARKL